jgi:hypothetical protein
VDKVKQISYILRLDVSASDKVPAWHAQDLGSFPRAKTKLPKSYIPEPELKVLV